MKGLRLIRERRGLTLQQTEEITGVALNTLSRYERGVISPTAETASRIAQALGVTVDELLNGNVKQEFEVKILMGVKTLPNVAGIEITDNSFFYGVDEEKPQIHIGGMVNIGTQQEREESLKKIIASFQKACWMFDHKGEAEAEMPDFSAIITALQPA